jgi:predicted ATPase
LYSENAINLSPCCRTTGENMSDVTISISDCNSIEKATIKLLAKRLNIKYGPNGIGKSTMAKAIKLSAENDLSSLTPFKSQGVEGAALPKIEGAEGFAI